MLNLFLEDSANNPLPRLSQLRPVVDSLAPSPNHSNNPNNNNNQQAVYSDLSQNLQGRECLGQLASLNRGSKEVDCLGQRQGQAQRELKEGSLGQRRSNSSSNSSNRLVDCLALQPAHLLKEVVGSLVRLNNLSNSLKRVVDCLEVRRVQRVRVREDCLDSRTKTSKSLREGCLEVPLHLRLALDCLGRPSSSHNSSKEVVSLGLLPSSLLRLVGCLDQQLNLSNNNSNNRGNSKVEGCLETLDSHKPNLQVVCLAVAHLVLSLNNSNNNRSNSKVVCSDPLLASLPVKSTSFNNPRLLIRACSRACLA